MRACPFAWAGVFHLHRIPVHTCQANHPPPGIKGEARRAAPDRPIGQALLQRPAPNFWRGRLMHKAPRTDVAAPTRRSGVALMLVPLPCICRSAYSRNSKCCATFWGGRHESVTHTYFYAYKLKRQNQTSQVWGASNDLFQGLWKERPDSFS
jgi:hypothetical protein